jgi:hypothetical protein
MRCPGWTPRVLPILFFRRRHRFWTGRLVLDFSLVPTVLLVPAVLLARRSRGLVVILLWASGFPGLRRFLPAATPTQPCRPVPALRCPVWNEWPSPAPPPAHRLRHLWLLVSRLWNCRPPRSGRLRLRASLPRRAQLSAVLPRLLSRLRRPFSRLGCPLGLAPCRGLCLSPAPRSDPPRRPGSLLLWGLRPGPALHLGTARYWGRSPGLGFPRARASAGGRVVLNRVSPAADRVRESARTRLVRGGTGWRPYREKNRP